MSFLACPHCGGKLFDVVSSGGGGAQASRPASGGGGRAAGGGQGARRGRAQATGPSAAERPVYECELDPETGEWEIKCPDHQWHRGIELAAQNGMPAVVKCTAKLADGKFCRHSTLLTAALRMVEAAGRGD